MRVLVDECLPRQLRQWLIAESPEWSVLTVQDSGWASMKNGALLRVANGSFDVLLTADKNLHHQQNFAGLDISVLVFPVNRIQLVRVGVHAIVQSLARVRPSEKAIMDLGMAVDWGSAVLDSVTIEKGIARHRFKPWP